MAERPLIGITTSLSGEKGTSRQVLDRAYVEAVERAGGCPVVVPVTASPETLRPLCRVLDGLVITGGPGITDGLVGSLPEDLPPTPRLRLADSGSTVGGRARAMGSASSGFRACGCANPSAVFGVGWLARLPGTVVYCRAAPTPGCGFSTNWRQRVGSNRPPIKLMAE